jgi:AraC-like DNA-binding protein
MRRSPIDWVPPGAWLAPGYAEWAPPAGLRGTVACLWARITPEAADPANQANQADQPGQAAARTGLVLPDACSDLIWERGVGAYVAGPDTGPARPMIKPGTVIVGIRFRPSAGGQVLKTPLSEIANQRVPLADLLPPVARRLSSALDPAEAADRVLAITVGLIADGAPDRAMARAAVLLRDPAARAEAVAAEIGLSERQFRRRSQAAAGYGPKTLQRVLRFHRFVRLLDAAPGDAHAPGAHAPAPTHAPARAPAPGPAPSARTRAPAHADAGLFAPPDLAALAAQAGYADQAHLTRECSALSGFTPAALARVRRARQG